MTLTIRPLPFALLMLAVILWLFKPQHAVLAAPVKAHGMTADEAIAIKDQRIERNFRSAYETAINR